MNTRSPISTATGLRHVLAVLALTLPACGQALAQGSGEGRPGRMAGGPGMSAMMHGPADGPGHHGAGGLPLSDHLLDAVAASSEQKARVHEIMKAAHDDLQAQREAGRSLHVQLVKLMTAPQIDAAAVEALRQQQLVRHDAASRRMTRAMIDAGNVLTAQQRQQLGERLAKLQDMAERHRMERKALVQPKG